METNSTGPWIIVGFLKLKTIVLSSHLRQIKHRSTFNTHYPLKRRNINKNNKENILRNYNFNTYKSERFHLTFLPLEGQKIIFSSKTGKLKMHKNFAL